MRILPPSWPTAQAVRLVLGTLVAALFLVGGSISHEKPSLGFQYVSPRPNSSLVSPRTNIIIRHGSFIDDKTLLKQLSKPNMLVVGSRSGVHPGALSLSDDDKTLVFKPDLPFSSGESVSVTLFHGVKSMAGRYLPGLSFRFSISPLASQQAPSLSVRTLLDSPGLGAGTSSPHRRARGSQRTGMVNSDCLPVDFPTLSLLTSENPDPGNVFIAPFLITLDSFGHLIILDNSGEPMFYRRMPALVVDFKLQPVGLLTYYDVARGKHYALDSTYAIVDSFSAGNGYATDLHELQLLSNGHALLMSYDPQPVAMNEIFPGGDPEAIVTGLIIQELDLAKNVVFQWRSWDHFQILDAMVSGLVNMTASTLDYVHGNAIELDHDGNLLISSRHMNEVTKIDRQTGEIIWRLGLNATNNQFNFTNDPRGFSHQHDIRRLASGNIALYDNGNFLSPTYSRAVEYQLDEVNMTATLEWEHRNNPDIFGPFMGSMQRRSTGGTTIGWGGGFVGAPSVTEVRADGAKAFELQFPDSFYSYRAFKFPWKTSLFTTNQDSLDFGTVPVGSSSWLSLSVYNTSASEVMITCFAKSEAAFVVQAALPFAIAPGDSVVVPIEFTPVTNGEFIDNLYVRAVNDTQLVAQTVVLSGAADWTSSADDPTTIPKRYGLGQNYPNPFNPVTTIGYDLPQAVEVHLGIFNTRGQLVATLVDGLQEPGRHSVVWNASGSADGVYYYRIRAGEYLESKKLVLVK